MNKFREALDAKVVSFTGREELEKEGNAFPGIEHVLCDNGFAGRLYNWAPKGRRQQAEALAGEADLITCHVMLRYHANWVMQMAKRHRIPYWFIPHGQLDPYVYTYRSVVKKVWAQIFGKRLLRQAAHIIFSTEQERNKASWLYSGPNTRVVHWPVDLIDLSGKEAARAEVRSRIGAKPDAKVLLFLGRMHPMKRPLETVEAFCLAANPDSHLVLIGPEDGVSMQACHVLALKAGMAGQVHAIGPVYGDDKETYLLGADAYVSLSSRENFNHTAAEALAAGVPVLLSPGNDLAPELKPYRCGWFLEGESEEEAVLAIKTCLPTSNEILKEMGTRGREFIAKECSFTGFRESLIRLRDEAWK
jgi:glycosyltransferase involved in cell wall biosynthesis